MDENSNAREPAEVDVKNLPALVPICEGINKILTPLQQSQPSEEKPLLVPENKSGGSPQIEMVISQDGKPKSGVETTDVVMECVQLTEENIMDTVEEKETPSLLETRVSDIEMKEAENDAELNEKEEKSDPKVIKLDI